MNRRNLLSLIGGAAAWPVAARAQQPGMPVIGWLSSRSAATDALVIPGFRRALAAQGYIEGQNVAIVSSFADGRYERLPSLAADLMSRHPSVVAIVGDGALGIRALHEVGATVPMIFVTAGDAVKLGLVTSLNHPGGDVTGVTSFQTEAAAKRVGILRSILPRLSRLGVLLNTTDSTSALEVDGVQQASRALSIQVDILKAGTEADLGAAFASAMGAQNDAIFVVTDPFFFTHAGTIVQLAARHGIPTMYYRREFTAAGGLMSYGTSTEEVYGILGDYAGRILSGAKAGELPVQQPTKFELVFNLKTAKALSLTVSPSMLAIADEVIE